MANCRYCNQELKDKAVDLKSLFKGGGDYLFCDDECAANYVSDNTDTLLDRYACDVELIDDFYQAYGVSHSDFH